MKGAEQYDPSASRANHRRAEARWAWILDRQVKAGLMKASVRAKFSSFPEPHKQSRTTSLGGQTGYLVDVANKYIKQHTGLADKDLAHGGYKIHTTFDKAKVRRLKGAVERVLDRDIDPKKRAADKGVQVGAASVRPSDGAIVALYGGADATRHFTNNADTSGVPVGSAFKPFVLASALDHGVRTPAGHGRTRWQPVSAASSYADDGSLTDSPAAPAVDGGGGTGTGVGRGPDTPATDSGSPTLRQALAKGGNATYVRLGKEVGWDRVRRTAVASGLLRGQHGPPGAAPFPSVRRRPARSAWPARTAPSSTAVCGTILTR